MAEGELATCAGTTSDGSLAGVAGGVAAESCAVPRSGSRGSGFARPLSGPVAVLPAAVFATDGAEAVGFDTSGVNRGKTTKTMTAAATSVVSTTKGQLLRRGRFER